MLPPSSSSPRHNQQQQQQQHLQSSSPPSPPSPPPHPQHFFLPRLLRSGSHLQPAEGGSVNPQKMRGRARRPIGELSFNWAYLLLEVATRLVLGLGMFLASRIRPFERQVYGRDWYSHVYPYAEKQRVSEGLAALILGGCLFVIPLVALTALLLTKKLPRNLAIEEGINFLLGVSMAILLAAFSTEVIKNTYGRLRPDFLSRCFGPDRNLWPVADVADLPPIPTCMSQLAASELRDGRKSFPSAHSSLSFAVYVFLGLFGYRKLSQLKNSGSLRIVWPFAVCLFATYIAVSRTQDYRHFGGDVLAGGLLGSLVALGCWRFYDRILESTYATYRARYGVDSGIKDMFHPNVPAMYTPGQYDEILQQQQSLLQRCPTCLQPHPHDDGHTSEEEGNAFKASGPTQSPPQQQPPHHAVRVLETSDDDNDGR